MVRYIIGQDGPDYDVMSKERYKALKDYECSWSWDDHHIIKKGDRYVRVVIKRHGESEVETQRVCFDCWCGISTKR
jgi:hypothetical protein